MLIVQINLRRSFPLITYYTLQSPVAICQRMLPHRFNGSPFMLTTRTTRLLFICREPKTKPLLQQPRTYALSKVFSKCCKQESNSHYRLIFSYPSGSYPVRRLQQGFLYRCTFVYALFAINKLFILHLKPIPYPANLMQNFILFIIRTPMLLIQYSIQVQRITTHPRISPIHGRYPPSALSFVLIGHPLFTP